MPGTITSWIASASLGAWKKKDNSKWPVVVGETLRRLTVEGPAGKGFRGRDTASPTNTAGVRNEARLQSHRPHHQMLVLEMTPEHGLGERLQPNGTVVLSSGNATSGAGHGLTLRLHLCPVWLREDA